MVDLLELKSLKLVLVWGWGGGCFFVCLLFQRTEVQVVYHLELHVAVNSYPERFLKSTVFYFIRNTKGENDGIKEAVQS